MVVISKYFRHLYVGAHQCPYPIHQQSSWSQISLLFFKSERANVLKTLNFVIHPSQVASLLAAEAHLCVCYETNLFSLFQNHIILSNKTQHKEKPMDYHKMYFSCPNLTCGNSFLLNTNMLIS